LLTKHEKAASKSITAKSITAKVLKLLVQLLTLVQLSDESSDTLQPGTAWNDTAQGKYTTQLSTLQSLVLAGPIIIPRVLWDDCLGKGGSAGAFRRAGADRIGSDRIGSKKSGPHRTELTKSGSDCVRLTKPGPDPKKIGSPQISR